MFDYNEWKKQMDANWEKVRKADEEAKAAGKLVGRYLDFPAGDGKAIYTITKENKTTVRVEVVTGIGDDWTIPTLGAGGTIKKEVALANVNRRDAFAKLFGK